MDAGSKHAIVVSNIKLVLRYLILILEFALTQLLAIYQVLGHNAKQLLKHCHLDTLLRPCILYFDHSQLAHAYYNEIEMMKCNKYWYKYWNLIKVYHFEEVYFYFFTYLTAKGRHANCFHRLDEGSQYSTDLKTTLSSSPPTETITWKYQASFGTNSMIVCNSLRYVMKLQLINWKDLCCSSISSRFAS